MTYQPKQTGFFIVGITTGQQNVGSVATNPSSGTISLDTFYTSSGALTSTPKATGLAISETRTDSISGLSPYFSQCPTASGGFGADCPSRLITRGCGVSLGTAFYNSNTVEIRYNTYDADRVLFDSYCAVFGGKS